MSLTVSITDQWHDGHRLHAIGKFSASGSYVTGGVTLDLSDVFMGDPPLFFICDEYYGYRFQYEPGTLANNGVLKIYGAGNAAAVGTLTSNNTNVSNNDTVTIGTQTYTFKTTLTATTTAYEVLIGADADASLLNLIRAINRSGTPGTDYGSLTPVNTSVSAATSVTAHAFAVTALISGIVGNLIATTEVAATLSWGAATLASGVDTTANIQQLAASTFPTNLINVPFYAIGKLGM